MSKDLSILKTKKLFLLDQDGTIYNDGLLFDVTLPFLKAVVDHGGQYVFITNNSSKSADAYVEKLQVMGIPVTKEQFLTSSQATVLYLKEHYPNHSVFCVGTESLKQELRHAGIALTNHLQADIALLGYDTELTYQKLNNLSEMLLTRDVPYIATNPDWVCPTRFGSVPDCGSMAQMIEHATKKTPFFIGKPRPTMIELAIERYQVAKEDVVVIGDRIYTDIMSAYHAGVTSVLVLSGEATLEDVEKSPVKPDFVIKDIGEIFK
ncbi:MAG: HAD-IIA family hydrolase [Methanomicrobia archaeon]|nr:HAD-IIA family hydrolase [Methanomicrobia archaeon]